MRTGIVYAILSFLTAFALYATGCASNAPKGDRTYGAQSGTANFGPIVYPDARRGDQVDVYHGIEVADPYRWLENPEAEEVRQWIAAEQELTDSYLATLPSRATIAARLTELWNYERYGTPTVRGGKYFYSRNDGLQNQSVFYVADSLHATPRVLIDPNTLSEDGTMSISGMSLSDDAKLLAYAVSDGGSDWNTWRIRDVATGKDLSDVIEWSKFSGVSWTSDGKGFYYVRYEPPAEGQELTGLNRAPKLMLHRLGETEDTVAYHRPDQERWYFDTHVSEDGKYLVMFVKAGTARENMIFYKDLTKKNSKIVELIDDFESQNEFVGSDSDTFYFFTTRNAPLGRLVAVDIHNAEPSAWREIVPESRDTMRGVSYLDGRFVVKLLHDACSKIEVWTKDGDRESVVELPGIGSASGFGGRADATETFYSFSSYTNPGAIYRYDMRAGKSELFRSPQVQFDSNDYVSKQIFYISKDGTRVPMTISYKKGLRRTGDNPTILYGYGGFNIPVTPYFKVSRLVWMEMGGIFAVANLRGGGEYGKPWHEAGMKLQKQNVFDDCHAAAEWLIDNRYTNPQQIGVQGGSNGGLLAAATSMQRPDLYGASSPAVGVLDMLRFNQFTIGWAWESDYGSPKNKDEFEVLYGYSPYHNTREDVEYPATLIVTADRDDRVAPAHSFKHTAALQRAQSISGGTEPILIRIETRAGHGAGKPTSKRIEEAADVWAFFARELDMNLDGWLAQHSKATSEAAAAAE